MGLPRWNISDKAERRFRSIILAIAMIILCYEKFYGSSSSQYAAMYLAIFAILACFLTNKIQQRFFTHVMEYAQAFRIVSLIMLLCFFCVWLYIKYQHFSNPDVEFTQVILNNLLSS
ncbi:hypothetical protein [Shewanella gaetbuli]|uniref:Uncharacterized protein n=1 Tax=Shewanella gaetbuli TaxID=220752 RepID=A0A9X1ZSD6_9GAMM|nr:hypothetical protein [Shewanella gaetbuli]MCL1141306.1 hypothetical protein [Shewanella gaetbuli]